MSAQEILDELEKLDRAELEKVSKKANDLLSHSEPGSEPELNDGTSLWERLRDLAGIAEGLPEDFAEQHDHYIHGTPKR